MSDQLVKTDLAVVGTCLRPWCSAGPCPEKGPACVNLQPQQKHVERENGSPSLFGLEQVSLYMAWCKIQWLSKNYVAVSRMIWLMGVRNEGFSFSVAICRSLHTKNVKPTV